MDALEELLPSFQPSLPAEIDHLTVFQRKVAQLKAAGVDTQEVARICECSAEQVLQALKNHKVQRLLLKIAAYSADDLRPAISEVNARIAQDAMEAHEAEVDVLRFTRRFMYEEANEVKLDTRLKAASVCAQTAQDLQDRAGATAPKKVEHKGLHVNISGEHAASLMQSLNELDALSSVPYTPVIVGQERNGDGKEDL